MRKLITVATVLLSGCASVSFTQLTPDLRSKAGTPNGAVYYLPKPYLLITQLPYTPTAGGPVTSQARDPAPPPKKDAKGGGDGWPVGYGSNQNGVASNQAVRGGADDKASGGDGPALATGSDQSFGGSSEGYLVKVIYLPDMSRPMSVAVRPGFGTASLKPTFQNGWMLTGFDASADSKTAEILTALAPLLTAYKMPGKAAATAATGGGSPAALEVTDTRPVLKPGLYEIGYGNADGKLKGICARTYFTAAGTVPATGTGACAQ